MIATALSPSRAETDPARLPLGLCLGFGVGSFGIAILLNTVTTFFPVLMTTVLGQSAAVAGLLLTVSKLYDVLADVVIGVASDRTRSRWGRRRPYLLAGAVVSAVSFLMIFSPPQLGESSLIPYVALALILYSTGYSLFAVPYIAMAGEMTDGFHERTRLLSFRTFFVSVGQLVGAAGMAAIVDWGGGGAQGYAWMGAAAASIIFTTMLLSFLGTARARQVRAAAPRALPQPSARILALLGNRPFVLLMSAKIVQYFAISIFTTTKLLFMLNVLGIGYAGLINLTVVQNVVGMLAVPLWTWAGGRFGKGRAYLAAILALFATYVSWSFIAPGAPMFQVWLRGGLNGVAATGVILLSISMLPDIMEFDRRRTGLRREGLFSSIYAFVEKLAYAVGPGLIGVLLASAGFVATTGGKTVVQSHSAVTALYAGMSFIPAGLALVSFTIMLFYRLDEGMLKATPDLSTPPPT
jgi:GPH family glycoside/pentoside/hexuronide:cation symporter